MNLRILGKNLPPAFGRNEVEKLFPGIITPKTLANLANKGEGPRYIKNGRLAVYVTADFLLWLEQRAKAVSTKEQEWEPSIVQAEHGRRG